MTNPQTDAQFVAEMAQRPSATGYFDSPIQFSRAERDRLVLLAAQPTRTCLNGCVYHRNDRECAARVIRPNYMGFDTSTFGCTLYAAAPAPEREP